jgi:hypothetical protein
MCSRQGFNSAVSSALLDNEFNLKIHPRRSLFGIIPTLKSNCKNFLFCWTLSTLMKPVVKLGTCTTHPVVADEAQSTHDSFQGAPAAASAEPNIGGSRRDLRELCEAVPRHRLPTRACDNTAFTYGYDVRSPTGQH